MWTKLAKERAKTALQSIQEGHCDGHRRLLMVVPTMGPRQLQQTNNNNLPVRLLSQQQPKLLESERGTLVIIAAPARDFPLVLANRPSTNRAANVATIKESVLTVFVSRDAGIAWAEALLFRPLG